MNNELKERNEMPEVLKINLPNHNQPKKSFRQKLFTLSNMCILVTVLLIVVGVLLHINAVRKGCSAAVEAYQNAKNKASEEAYNKFYETAYVSAERKYHVSNRTTIDVSSVREEEKLEVLKVNDVEYVIETAEDNDDTDVWLEVYGEGVYTVDLKASEFIIDSDRQYVLVRVPRPELTQCKITEVNQLLWKDNKLFNQDISSGAEMAADLRAAGETKLNNYMKSSAEFYKSAKSSAQTVISNFVKGVNSELTDLVVEVEFMD